MQDAPAEGEIDWIPLIESLVASPQPGHTAYPTHLERPAPSDAQESIDSQSHHGIMAAPRVPSWGLPVQPTQFPWNNAAHISSGTHGEPSHPYGWNNAHLSAQDHMDAHGDLSARIRAGQFAMLGDYSGTSVLGRPQAALLAPSHNPIGQAPNRGILGSSMTSTGLRTSAVDADPPWLNAAQTQNIMPLHTDAVVAMPFSDPIFGMEVPKHGVIRFVDPPFYVTRTEVLTTLGKAKVVYQPSSSPYRAVHILMERETGKTQDVFVEVESNKEAQLIVEQFKHRNNNGRSRTLGKAKAQVELSNQETLMRAVFPQARKTHWQGAKAVIDTDVDYYYEDGPAVGFDGFLGNEECALLCKWLDSPHRSPFAQNCQNRPYENVITIFHNYPLDNTSIILMGDRRKMFDIASTAVRTLCALLRQSTIPQGITDSLLQELVVATSGSRLLGDQQKALLLQTLGEYGFQDKVLTPNVLVDLGGTHKYARSWPFIALQRSVRATDKMVDFYGKLIREYNQQYPPADMTPSERQAFSLASKSFCLDEPFMGVRIRYSSNMRDDLDKLSWRQVIEIETHYLSTALRLKCPQDRAPMQECFGTRFHYGL